jgi:hypothetical protein
MSGNDINEQIDSAIYGASELYDSVCYAVEDASVSISVYNLIDESIWNSVEYSVYYAVEETIEKYGRHYYFSTGITL